MPLEYYDRPPRGGRGFNFLKSTLNYQIDPMIFEILNIIVKEKFNASINEYYDRPPTPWGEGQGFYFLEFILNYQIDPMIFKF